MADAWFTTAQPAKPLYPAKTAPNPDSSKREAAMANMAIGGWDGKAKIHDTTTGDQASLVAVAKKIISRLPLISITRLKMHAQRRGISASITKHLYPSEEQFDHELNRPDVVVETLGCGSPELVKAYHQAYKKRLRKMNFTEEMSGVTFICRKFLCIHRKNSPYDHK